MSLDEIATGQKAQILSLNGLPRTMRKKLMSLGILPNTTLTIVRRAPLGDPIQVSAPGINLALSNGQAKAIEVDSL
ncbi:FeoA family protein [Agarivorans albus]|uniref:Ferrous iron transport protein A n=1 Tax=Agarivorans albus MKT 106 TaxID=1331007 RepID=R9PSV1_AGAAL|nr:FeoA family protein [Agarivorans albus]GAD01311.1 ferrous iron transport protein A [Agarivorans albus MKT 106]